MKLKPLFDYIVVERDKAEVMTEHGLHLPQNALETPTTGTVIRVGEGRLCPTRGDQFEHEGGQGYCQGKSFVEPLRVKVGDRVIFGQHAGIEIEIDKQKVLLMKEDDLFGLLEEETPVAQEVREEVASATA